MFLKNIETVSYSHSISRQTDPMNHNCNCSFSVACTLRKTAAEQPLWFLNIPHFLGLSLLLLNENHVRRRLLTDVAINKNEISVDFIEEPCSFVRTAGVTPKNRQVCSQEVLFHSSFVKFDPTKSELKPSARRNSGNLS